MKPARERTKRTATRLLLFVAVATALFALQSCTKAKKTLQEEAGRLVFLEDRGTVERKLAGFVLEDVETISRPSSTVLFDSHFPKTNCVIRTCVWYGHDTGFSYFENLDLFFDENDRLIGWNYWYPD